MPETARSFEVKGVPHVCDHASFRGLTTVVMCLAVDQFNCLFMILCVSGVVFVRFNRIVYSPSAIIFVFRCTIICTPTWAGPRALCLEGDSSRSHVQRFCEPVHQLRFSFAAVFGSAHAWEQRFPVCCYVHSTG